IVELRLVARERRHPRIEISAHIDRERRAHARRDEVIVDRLGLMRIPLHRRLRKMREVERLRDENPRLEMVIVSEAAPDRQIVVGSEEDLGSVFPYRGGYLAAIL